MTITRQQFAGNESTATATTIAATFANAIQAGEKVLVIVNRVTASDLTPGTLDDPSAAVFERISHGPHSGTFVQDVFLCRNHPGGETVVTYTGPSSTFRSIGAWRITSDDAIAVLHGAAHGRTSGSGTDGYASRALYIASTAMLFASCKTDGGANMSAGTNWSASSANGGDTGNSTFESRSVSSAASYSALFTPASAENGSVCLVALIESTVQPPYVVSVAAVTGTTSTFTATMPPDFQDDDYLIWNVENAGSDPKPALSTANGFAEVATESTGSGTRETVFTKFATSSSDSAPILGDPGDHCIGGMICVRNVDQTSPINASATTDKGTASTTRTFVGVTTNVDKCLVMQLGCHDLDRGTGVLSGNPANTNLDGLSQIMDGSNASGNGGGVMAVCGVKQAAGATGDTTQTEVSARDCNITLALKPGNADTNIIIATGRADETDTALALTHKKIKAVGRSNETDQALQLTMQKTRTVGRANETDQALALVRTRVFPIGRADELDEAHALGLIKIIATGRADEIDQAFTLQPAAKLIPVGMAQEEDEALALTGVKQIPVGQAEEIDEALRLTATYALPVGMAEEMDRAYNPASFSSRIACVRFGELRQRRMTGEVTERALTFTLTQRRIQIEMDDCNCEGET